MIDHLAKSAITYVASNGETTHAPLMRARIRGWDALFVIDTGSEVHVLTEELVDRLELPREPGEEGTDHSGATMASWSVSGVEIEIGEAVLALERVFTIPAPQPFVRMGIAGALSPQHLHPTAVAILDMAANELGLADATDDQVADLIEADGGAVLRLRRSPRHPTTVIRAAIDGFAEVDAMLDSGGKRTEFSAAAVHGLAEADPERLGGGVFGSDVMGWEAGPQTLVIGNHRLPVPSLAVRNNLDDPQAIIGMDVLAGTVIAAAADTSRPVFLRLRANQER